MFNEGANRSGVDPRRDKPLLEWPAVPEATHETTKKRLEEYRAMIISAGKSPWKLAEVGQNTKYGASAYGYFLLEGTPITAKIRLSDHVGRWSGFDLDIRQQTFTRMREILENFLKTRAEEYFRKLI